jgi:hypothetical protein
MRPILLALAAPLAALAISAPAQAQVFADPGLAAAPGAVVQRHLERHDRDGRRHDRRRHRGRDNIVVFGGPWGSPEAWALYNNRSWEPDSFNDWWHERPWRAYPRWIQRNQDCARMWWGGGAWRCSW